MIKHVDKLPSPGLITAMLHGYPKRWVLNLSERRAAIRWALRAMPALIVSVLLCHTALAGVIVVANRTRNEIDFAVIESSDVANARRTFSLAAMDVVGVHLAGPAAIEFSAGGQLTVLEVSPSRAYYFHPGEDDRGPHIKELGLGDPTIIREETGRGVAHRTLQSRSGPGGVLTATAPAPAATIYVKILVDEENPSARTWWEKKIRKRIETASDLLQRHCFVRLEVVATDTWQSDDDATAFVDSLREFESEVSPEPADVAIGFTSQYVLEPGRTRLGGTRGPFRSHILIRERAPHITEPERMELLLHEIGHYLGATHSPESDSAMRPRLGDKQALAQRFRVGFDPANTLILCLIGDELRARRVQSFADLTPPTRSRLRQIYTAIAEAMPLDPASPAFLRYLDLAEPPPQRAKQYAVSLDQAVREILQAVVTRAALNDRQPRTRERRTSPSDGLSGDSSGDALMEWCVRTAAGAADRLPEELRVQAFLLALGRIANPVDESPIRFKQDGFWKRVESDLERSHRMATIDRISIQGRNDLARHFVLSAVMTAVLGPQLAESAGILKEVADASAGREFSISDYCADLAGIAFAQQLQSQETALSRLTTSFTLADYVPDMNQLKNQLALKNAGALGMPGSPQFRELRRQLIEQIDALPGHQRLR